MAESIVIGLIGLIGVAAYYIMKKTCGCGCKYHGFTCPFCSNPKNFE